MHPHLDVTTTNKKYIVYKLHLHIVKNLHGIL